MCDGDEKHIGFEIRKTANKIFRFMDNNGHKKEIDDITGTNGWIIGYLSHHASENIYQRDLEKKFGITRSTASKVINLMVKKELIERQNVEHDARLKKLVLTQKAKSISDLMRDDMINLEKKLSDNFTETEKNQLIDYLIRIQNNLEG